MSVSKTLRLAKRFFCIFLHDLKTETICILNDLSLRRNCKRLLRIFLRDLRDEIIYTLNDFFLWRNCRLMSCKERYQVKGREVQIVIKPQGYTVLHYICGDYSYKGRSTYCRYDQLLAPLVNRSHYD